MTAQSALSHRHRPAFDRSSQHKLQPPFNESQQLLQQPAVLPALFRSLVRSNGNPCIRYEPDFDPSQFIHQEISVERLDAIIGSLWLGGVPNNIRPLHRQLSLGRNIVVTEEVDLHLLWGAEQLFLKPIPLFLLNFESYQTYVCNAQNADPHYLAKAALGFLGTYCRLIIHDSDFRIAQREGLIPNDITYEQWTAFAKDIVRSMRSERIAPRYYFGELRLSRINMVYRLSPRMFPRHLIRGYWWGTNRYSTFLSANFRWLLIVFIYLGVTLGAFQVAVGTTQGERYAAFESAGFYVSVISLFVLALIFLGLVFALTVAIVVNTGYAWRMDRAFFNKEEKDIELKPVEYVQEDRSDHG